MEGGMNEVGEAGEVDGLGEMPELRKPNLAVEEVV